MFQFELDISVQEWLPAVSVPRHGHILFSELVGYLEVIVIFIYFQLVTDLGNW